MLALAETEVVDMLDEEDDEDMENEAQQAPVPVSAQCEPFSCGGLPASSPAPCA
jgi:hypothetical protein